MIEKSNRIQGLASYLATRLEYLRATDAEIEGKLSDDMVRLCESVDAGALAKDDHRVGQIVRYIEHVVGNTFRYSMLIAVCSFLEEAMKAIGNEFLDDYEGRIRRQKRGDWLTKAKRVLSAEADVSFGAIQAELHHFQNLIILRNCIVHAWGKISGCRDREKLPCVARQVNDVEVSKDGFLVLGDQVVPQAILAAEEVIDGILTEGFRASIT